MRSAMLLSSWNRNRKLTGPTSCHDDHPNCISNEFRNDSWLGRGPSKCGIALTIAGWILSCQLMGNAADETQSAPPRTTGKAISIPDYTHITGFVETATLPITEPVLLWKLSSEFEKQDGKASDIGLSDSVVAEGVLYFGDDHGSVTAFRARDQQELWSHEHGSRISTVPSVDETFVYFGSMKGITALRRKDGELAWQFEIVDGAGECTPLPIGDAVYVSGYDGHAYRLQKQSGKVVWDHNFVDDAPDDQPGFEGAKARLGQCPARPCGSSSDGKLFIQSVFDQSRVIAVDCETGKRRWAFQTAGWVSPAPTIADDRVYVVSQDEHLYCLELQTGQLIWKFKAQRWLASRVAVHDGQVYLPHHRARLYQLNASTGDVIRIMEPPDESDRKGAVYSFPLLTSQTAYFACGNGMLFAFDLQSGAMRWKSRPVENSEFYSSPSTDGQTIFATCRRTQKGEKSEGENAIIAIGLAPSP